MWRPLLGSLSWQKKNKNKLSKCSKNVKKHDVLIGYLCRASFLEQILSSRLTFSKKNGRVKKHGFWVCFEVLDNLKAVFFRKGSFPRLATLTGFWHFFWSSRKVWPKQTGFRHWCWHLSDSRWFKLQWWWFKVWRIGWSEWRRLRVRTWWCWSVWRGGRRVARRGRRGGRGGRQVGRGSWHVHVMARRVTRRVTHLFFEGS